MANPHPSVSALVKQSLQIQTSNQLIASFPCENLLCLLSLVVAFLGFHDPFSSLSWISDLAMLLHILQAQLQATYCESGCNFSCDLSLLFVTQRSIFQVKKVFTRHLVSHLQDGRLASNIFGCLRDLVIEFSLPKTRKKLFPENLRGIRNPK